MPDALSIAKKVEVKLDMHIKECDARTLVVRQDISAVGDKIDGDREKRNRQDRRVLVGIISILGMLMLSAGTFFATEVWTKTHPAETGSSHSYPVPRR